MSNPLDEIYQAVILEHANNSPFRGVLEGAQATLTADNPLCGDTLELSLLLEGGKIDKAHFDGKGCKISMAAASLIAECLQGLTRQEALDLLVRYREWMRGGAVEDASVGELKVLAGVKRLPVRIRCALLAGEALEKFFENAEREENGAN